ncbi:MAG: ubiquinol-cytochrome C chaperone family protein [Hyphomicrobiales bacterium]
MLRKFFKTKQSNDTVIRGIYGEIVAQARHTSFYEDFGVPDTLDGRFNMIVLHNFLLFRRLKDVDEATRAVSQDVFDMFRLDMDRSLRELGVGDTTVPKRMKKMMQVFYGRTDAYEEALNAEQPKPDLVDALSRNILSYNESLFSEEGESAVPKNAMSEKAEALADYVLATTSALEKQNESDIMQGSLSFPTPKAYN